MNGSIRKRHRRILQGSILLSIFFHMAEIHFLQRQSLWFSSPSLQESSAADWISTMEKQEKDQILKKFFACFEAPSNKNETLSKKSNPQPLLIQKPIAAALQRTSQQDPPLQEHCIQEPVVFSSPVPFSELYSHALPIVISNPFEKSPSLFSHLPRGLVLPSPNITNPTPPSIPTPLYIPLVLHEDLPKENKEIPLPEIAFAVQPQQNSSWKTKLPLPKASLPTQPSIPKIPSLTDLQTLSCSNSFDTELVFIEQEEGKYIFALTLIPRQDLKLTPLKQNYCFLIDRSNSIQGERLQAAKSAVRKAIDELTPDDLFNIIVFDQKVDKLSAKSIPATGESISKAQAFLNKIELGNFFSQSNLYKPLFLTIPSTSYENELYTAILLTDGESLGQKNMVENLLNDWTHMNNGKVALFTLGMNDDAHLETLNTIATFNRGKTTSSPTKRGLKRKLLKLMKTIHSPLAKNLTCKAISRSPQETIELFPKTNHTPHLYLNEPYVILGTTDSLDDFIIFVQGRLNGEWLHIKKNISFLNAKKGNPSLISEWALQKAFTLYQEYQRNEDSRYLAEAQILLKSHDLQRIFE